MLHEDLVQPITRLQDMPRVNIDFRRLPRCPTEHLMNHHLGIRENKPLPLLPCGEEKRSGGGSHTDTDRLHIRLHELHRVIDRERRCHRSARRIDIHLDILLVILLREEEELCNYIVRHIIIDGAPEENNPVLE